MSRLVLGGEVLAWRRYVGCLSHGWREEVLGLYVNRCVREVYLSKTLSNSKLEAVRGRRLLFVGP